MNDKEELLTVYKAVCDAGSCLDKVLFSMHRTGSEDAIRAQAAVNDAISCMHERIKELIK